MNHNMLSHNIFYDTKACPCDDMYKNLKKELVNLDWCRPPSGRFPNKTPRYVCVLGDMGLKHVSYPMFQTDKDCVAIYKTRPFPDIFKQYIKLLKIKVKYLYKDKAQDIDNMFNVAICNLYTEKQHKISAHRDDERWLSLNELDKNKKPCHSIIASLTIYPEQNENKEGHIREFQIWNDGTNKWNTIPLENRSLIFFSNHKHRLKHVPKKKKNQKRINVTFRTIQSGLIGYIGLGNFYRYMSLPYQLLIPFHKKDITDKLNIFIEMIKETNLFLKREIYPNPLRISYFHYDQCSKRNKNNKEYNSLPWYIQSLCTYHTLCNYIKNKEILY